jgi:hypothetical protein
VALHRVEAAGRSAGTPSVDRPDAPQARPAGHLGTCRFAAGYVVQALDARPSPPAAECEGRRHRTRSSCGCPSSPARPHVRGAPRWTRWPNRAGVPLESGRITPLARPVNLPERRDDPLPVGLGTPTTPGGPYESPNPGAGTPNPAAGSLRRRPDDRSGGIRRAEQVQRCDRHRLPRRGPGSRLTTGDPNRAR